MRSSRYELALLVAAGAVLVWSGIAPRDRFTWLLEVAPVLIGVPILVALRQRLRLTRLVYTLLWIHAIILMVGGKYTYAEVPFGFWLQDAFGLSRNHYDRIGHFAQGFIPAMLAREVLIRRSPLADSRWLSFLVVCFCLAFSALYELIEFWTALATGEAAEAFLGTQGDVWDTQWDMQMALLGAVTALVTISSVHDRQLAGMRPSPASGALLVIMIGVAIGCGDGSRPEAGASASSPTKLPPPKPKVWEPKPVVAPPPDATADTLPVPADTAPPKPHPRGPRPFVLSPADSAKWPVAGPKPLPGALLPDHRIVAYYGNPRSTRMGVLGRIPPDSMLPRLEQVAMRWALADPDRKVMPALHLIATVAQGSPGPGKQYRLRMGDSVINTVASWAEERGWIVFLDIQTGQSTIEHELPPLLPFLQRPYVHLALDPEFAMKGGGIPGKRIGTLDAVEVNHAIEVLGKLVTEHKLPPKVLIVHRFTRKMLTNTDSIRLDPRVQVVIQMDGFGAPYHKQDAYRFWISPYPVEFTGFKLFYKNDREPKARAAGYVPSCDRVTFELVGCGDDGLMTPEQVMSSLYPVPLYIQYQ